MSPIGFVEPDDAQGEVRCVRFASLISLVGVASALRDAWPGASGWPFDLHAAFGALLCLLVVTQFHAAGARPVPFGSAGLNAFSRGLTRLVFLLLYTLFGVSGLVNVLAALWNHGVHGSAPPAMSQPPEALRDYLAYGVAALVIIRVLAAAMSQRLPTVSTTKESAISAGRG